VYGYNNQGRSSTGLSPFELVLPRPPPVPIMEVRPIAREGKSKAGFRKEFLSRVRDLSWYTKESLEKAQARYKAVYDAHVRQKNAKIVPGVLVLVKTFADSGGLPPKLLSPTAGPYHVVAFFQSQDGAAKCMGSLRS
jgi:hypothetical protein